MQREKRSTSKNIQIGQKENKETQIQRLQRCSMEHWS